MNPAARGTTTASRSADTTTPAATCPTCQSTRTLPGPGYDRAATVCLDCGSRWRQHQGVPSATGYGITADPLTRHPFPPLRAERTVSATDEPK